MAVENILREREKGGSHMNRKKIAGLCAVLLLLICGCENSAVFLPDMSAYIACGEGETWSAAFTLFSEDFSFKPEEVSAVELPSFGDAVDIAELRVEKAEMGKKYESLAVTFSFTPLKEGTFKENKLILHFRDGSKAEYPIGEWVLDAGEKTEGALLTVADQIAATSNNEKLLYSYELAPGAKVVRIQYGPDAWIEDENGLSAKGEIALPQGADIHYIREKITVEYEGEEYTYYSMGCYYGALTPLGENRLEEWEKNSGK